MLIPVTEVQVRASSAKDMESHFLWELIHLRSQLQRRSEKIYVLSNRYRLTVFLLELNFSKIRAFIRTIFSSDEFTLPFALRINLSPDITASCICTCQYTFRCTCHLSYYLKRKKRNIPSSSIRISFQSK